MRVRQASLAASALLLLPTLGRAACNIIPPAAESFPSTLGSVSSPVTTAGNEIELRLSACDVSPGFAPSSVVSISFLPAGPGQPPPVTVSGGALSLADCAAGGAPPCATLRFTMPATPNLAGPAEILVTTGAADAARIGPLFQPHELGSTCDKQPETIFRSLTVVPPPNDFAAVQAETTPVLATLDGSGSLLIPLNYTASGLLPLGPGAPVARLLAGVSTIDAFDAQPGTQLVQVDSPDVRSFTLQGRPLPPLIRATNLGNEVFGLSDAAESVIRVARLDVQGRANFDLGYRRTNGGYGPIIIGQAKYAVRVDAAVPLDDLRSTTLGVAFTRDESLEGNLNDVSFGSPTGDSDATDDVAQIIDVATFTSTNTGMAASPTNNPIVGGAVVETGGALAALLESETEQNCSGGPSCIGGATDLNGNGQTSDDVLRVFNLTGVLQTPDASRLGSPFPAINRRPLAIDGALTYYRTPTADVAFVNHTPNGDDVAVSPDGRLFAAADRGTGGVGVVRVIRRDGETGDSVRTADGSRVVPTPIASVAFNPSGGVYAAVPGSNQLRALGISLLSDQIVVGGDCLVSGDLGFETTATDGVAGVDGLQGVTRIAITPRTADGRTSLYALGAGENALAAFNVSPQFSPCNRPRLTFEQVLRPANFSGAQGLAVSADGAHVYVAVAGTSRVKGFARTVGTATLTEIGEWVDGGAGGNALGGAFAVTVSPDGRFVYALAVGDAAITTFSRNPATGLLTLVAVSASGGNLGAATSLGVSPDGLGLYAGTTNGQTVVFARNTATGALSLVSVRGPVVASFSTPRMAISPDSEHVYLALGSLTTSVEFGRTSALQAFDASTQTDRSALGTPSQLAAVAAGRAAWLEPAGDGFATVKLYDAAANSVAPVPGATARRLALSSRAIVLAVPQSIVGDVDNDGSINDDAVALVSTTAPGDGIATVLGTDAIELGATDVCEGGSKDGQACATDSQCPGGACGAIAVATAIGLFDFDGHAEVVLRVFRQATNELSAALGQNVADFQVSGSVVAFRSSESGFFTTADLNGDGDTTDIVMQVYDLATRQLINTGQATIKCEVAGCEPGLPYQIRGNEQIGYTVAFLTREFDQGSGGGTDLNANGTTSDTVVQLFRVRTGTTTVVDTPVGNGGLPPLPTELAGGAILYRQALESTLGPDRDGNGQPDGVDVNRDGDLNDIVTLVDGDADGDGTFDSSDICRETTNASQRDSDSDGLGDACDPTPLCNPVSPGSPPIAPPTAFDCQKVIGSASRALLKSQFTAVRKCLDKLAAGKLVGDATPLCRGSVSGGSAILPDDPKTEEGVFKAMLRFLGTVDDKCPPATLAQLDTCGASPSALVGCVSARTTEMIGTQTTVLYGDARSLPTKAAAACQKSLGSGAARAMLGTVAAMQSCLDAINRGTLTGNAQAICLGARTPAGFVPPTDPATAAQLVKADLALLKALQKKCPAAVAASLESCGGDPVGLAACTSCTGFEAVIGLIADTYGGP
jgi:Lactonase, 7-bladed beta-propeller